LLPASDTLVQPRPQIRLAPEARKRLIVETAADFFAEHGFEGGTADLARRLGVSQSLLYRYFSSKQDLINQVYEHVFPSQQYYARWLRELDDYTVPLRDRLVRFYCEYADALLTPKFLRLSIWARLSIADPNAKYTAMLDEEILPRIARGLRRDVLGSHRAQVTPQDIERVQTLHGSIYYVAIRRMHERLSADVHDIVISKIDVFLEGARNAVARANRPD
jgi:AcrR family transcriptional regulator